MEVELKYAVPDERTLDAIWHDERLLSMMEAESRSVAGFDGSCHNGFLSRRRIYLGVVFRCAVSVRGL